ncbi:dynamin family protein [Trichococcus pasteurii]|uniref:HTH cro/C1-type domain-containing protein n=1 Tax=Trichococcus pasteurii TaxID=43064 RepID=A0A1W1IJD8_9LACT|nr:dynamin family protein [Trichococcus pasteurii]SFF00027.1 Helix-turn-helix [Trichococcus pasteurii]SLM53112.1 Hypothetical protein TPAS_2839 [Trichococcus pasteurii]SSB93993.1 Hypothetical protein TPAS_2839 [Trichococcus pasteurii]
MFDLKGFREDNLKITQVEFAEMIGTKQDTVSRWEENSGLVTIDDLKTIAEKCGVTIDQLVMFNKSRPKPLDVENSWRVTEFTKKTIVDYIEPYLSEKKDTLDDKYYSFIADLKTTVNSIISKPKVAIVGRSDVGKSALINSILGAEKMPTSWTPTTSIVVYIKHVDDRPKYIEEDVWIFKASLGEEKNWDDHKLYDEEYCRAWKIAGGSADILKNYGTRQGEDFDKNEAGAAVVFVDSSLLNVCDIIDLPGFGTGDRVEDDLMTLRAKQAADILIYMSIANGFMRSEDIEYIKESVQNLVILEDKENNDIEPFSNLYILASQAQTVNAGNKTSLHDILNSGCERLNKTIPSNFWNSRKSISKHNYTYENLRNRFFTYTTDIESLREDFNKDFTQMIERLPLIINEKAIAQVRSFAESVGIDLSKEIEYYTQLAEEREKYVMHLAKFNKNEPKRAKDNKKKRKYLIDYLHSIKQDSAQEFVSSYNKIIANDNIASVIKQQGFKKKKEDMQALASYLNSQLQTALQDTLQKKTELLNKEIDTYIGVYQKSINESSIPGISISMPPFNVARAFASGLAGLTTFGALAFWASTFGNLGAYILVAKGVSLLSALGISVGGTAAAVSTVAAIGGPIVLGVALAIITALSVFAIFSGGWEQSIAKKIVAEYDKNNCLLKFEDIIDDYWKDTEMAFNASADKLESDWKKYLKDLSDIVNNNDIEEIQHKIKLAKDVQSFFDNIPLPHYGLDSSAMEISDKESEYLQVVQEKNKLLLEVEDRDTKLEAAQSKMNRYKELLDEEIRKSSLAETNISILTEAKKRLLDKQKNTELKVSRLKTELENQSKKDEHFENIESELASAFAEKEKNADLLKEVTDQLKYEKDLVEISSEEIDKLNENVEDLQVTNDSLRREVAELTAQMEIERKKIEKHEKEKRENMKYKWKQYFPNFEFSSRTVREFVKFNDKERISIEQKLIELKSASDPRCLSRGKVEHEGESFDHLGFNFPNGDPVRILYQVCRHSQIRIIRIYKHNEKFLQ